MRVDVCMMGFGQINLWLPQSPEQIRESNAQWLAAGQMTQEQVDQIEQWLVAHETAHARGYRIKTHARSLKDLEQCRKTWHQSTIGEPDAPDMLPADVVALHNWAYWQERYLTAGWVLQVAPTDPKTGLVLGTMIFSGVTTRNEDQHDDTC